MATVRWHPLLHQSPLLKNPSIRLIEQHRRSKASIPSIRGCSLSPFVSISNGYNVRSVSVRATGTNLKAKAAQSPPLAGAAETDLLFSETFPIKHNKAVEGKASVKLDAAGEDKSRWRLVIGCNLEGKWVLHWGVTYCDDLGSEWDQPPIEMRPPGSIPIKDYAIETPLKEIEGKTLHELQIEFDGDTPIFAINFVLKEEETGSWIQYKGMDFRIPLRVSLEDANSLSAKQGLGVWPGAFEQLSNFLMKPEGPSIISTPQENDKFTSTTEPIKELQEEFVVLKEVPVQNSLIVNVRKSDKSDKIIVQFDTDIPGPVIVHWGVCKDESKNWEVPSPPYPLATRVLRKKALQTLLEQKSDGSGSQGSFLVDDEILGLLFVLKLDEYTWINNLGTDFYIPIINLTKSEEKIGENQPSQEPLLPQEIGTEPESASSNDQNTPTTYTENIISGIRNLVTDISTRKTKREEKTKEEQESILQEIEKLVAEAYNIFVSSSSDFVPEESVSTDKPEKPTAVEISSGTGNGHEILCQGFNWESHKSGKWYLELQEKASLLASLGFSVVWLPPPTESVSPEGYMPKDLYNLNSRYGSMEQLKEVVKKFHEVGIKVLGDVVLNHRCAHFQNKNGIWNIFGGRLNWDDTAIVADDPHFHGRGNKSSGDNFHAAPNIDHSQEFVRNDIKEWLHWLRTEVGYDGWRLDFVRGFWGGYVKDYLEATKPYFAVGEYWDSLSYNYGEMEYNQDQHRQRVINWINATDDTAGAFDVTTKGILHSALERREYWRLSDPRGKPPGVVGWWPSRAVTFIENHDTGSTQGHWRFPAGKEMQGYVYILTHPGTPSVFYDHIFSHYQQEIAKLLSLRRKLKIHCRSRVKMLKAEGDVYAAEIDEKLVMKIGPGHYEPKNEPNKNWALAAEGQDYKVWEVPS